MMPLSLSQRRMHETGIPSPGTCFRQGRKKQPRETSLFLPFESASNINEPDLKHIRVVARIRPLSKEEKESKAEYSIWALSGADSINRDENSSFLVRQTSKHWRMNSPDCALNSFRIPANTQFEPLNGSSRIPSTRKSITAPQFATSLLAIDENRVLFDLDAVLPPSASQKEVYDASIGDAVRDNIFRGYNTTVIATGTGGSGKSYTMSGGWKTDFASTENLNSSTCAADEDDGILPRAVHDLFKVKQCYTSAGQEVNIKMSFVEISNDTFRDFFSGGGSADQCKGKNGLDGKDISWVPVDSPEKVRKLMERASKYRAKREFISRRCHLVCSFHVRVTFLGNASIGDLRTPPKVINAKLTLVNLASQPEVSAWDHLQHNRADEDTQALQNLINALGARNKPERSDILSAKMNSMLVRTLSEAFGGEYRF